MMLKNSDNLFDINELALNLQDSSSVKTNLLDFVNDVPTYEYPDHDMVIPANSEMDAVDYAYRLSFPDIDDIAPNTQDTVPEIPDRGSLNYGSFSNSEWQIDFPDVKRIGRLPSFNIMAELFKCAACPSSYLEFWFLDIVEECLMFAQDCPEISQENTGFIVRFLILFLRDVRVQQLDMCGMLTYFKLKLESYERKLLFNNISVIFEGESSVDEISSSEQEEYEMDNTSPQVLQQLTTTDVSPKNWNEVFFILEYIYKAFGNSFIYRTLQIAMLDPPAYVEQDLPYRIEYPKQYLPTSLENSPAQIKEKPQKKTKAGGKSAKAKKKNKKKGKEKKTGKKSRESSPNRPTEEELEQLRIAEELKWQTDLKKYILPLKMSVGPEYYEELFKPPPIPEKKEKKKKDKGKGKTKKKAKAKY